MARIALASLMLSFGACSTLNSGALTSSAPPASAAGKSSAPARSVAGLPPASAVRDWKQYRLQAAKRLVAANPGITYTSSPPDILLAIPVLEIELNADGSIKRINVMRYPGQAPETVAIAMDAVKRAAPYGDVSRLPKPWRFVETFLFNNERLFKPRTLDS